MNRQNLLRGLALASIASNFFSAGIMSLFIDAPNTRMVTIITGLSSAGLFMLASSRHYKLAMHLFTAGAFISMGGLMLATPEIEIIYVALVPIFLVNLFYDTRTALFLSVLGLVLTNVYALTYIASQNPYEIELLVAYNLLMVSLTVFVLISTYQRVQSEGEVATRTQQLKESEARFRGIVNQSPNFIAIYDVTTQALQSWNREVYLGYVIRDFVSIRHWSNTVHSDSTEIIPDIAVVITGAEDVTRHYEIKVWTKEKAIRWVSLQISTLQSDGAGTVSLRLITVNDITASKEIEHRKLHDSLEEHKETMLTGIIRSFSHEFRTPLSIIETNLYLMRRKVANKLIDENLETIRGQVRQITVLTEQLNMLIRLKNKPDLSLMRIDINQMMQHYVDRQRKAIERKQLILDNKIGKTIVYSLIDVKFMTILLDNVVDNAIKFTDEGGTITFETAIQDKNAKISIRDTGIGIDDAILERVYDLFTRADKAHTSTGLGIGLSIVKTVADSHGFQLAISSEDNCCTTVELIIPILREKQNKR